MKGPNTTISVISQVDRLETVPFGSTAAFSKSSVVLSLHLFLALA
jgi:hypothetical protein